MDVSSNPTTGIVAALVAPSSVRSCFFPFFFLGGGLGCYLNEYKPTCLHSTWFNRTPEYDVVLFICPSVLKVVFFRWIPVFDLMFFEATSNRKPLK